MGTRLHRISEFKDEYVNHHPFPDSYPRPYLNYIEDNLKVSNYMIGYVEVVLILLQENDK